MSLSDALLLEPYRTDVWVALRTDLAGGRLVIENNVIELIPQFNVLAPLPVGVLLGFGQFVSPPLFPQVVIRNNVFRHLDDIPDPSALAIWLSSCGNAIVENNVVDLLGPTPIQYKLVGSVRFLNNQTPAGTLIQGVDVTVGTNPIKQNELTTDIEDAALLAF